MRPTRFLIPALLAAISTLGDGAGGPRVAAAADVRKGLASVDAVEVFEAITDAAAQKDPALAGPLLDAGWQNAHPHIAVACGEALHAIGPKAAEDAEYARVLAKALHGKDPRGLENLARVLGGYGLPVVDEPLAYLAAGQRAADVQAEALYLIGRLHGTSAEYPKCVAAVQGALRETEPAVLCAACAAAAGLQLGQFSDELSAIVRRSVDRRSGLFAVMALRRIGKPVAIGPFLHVVSAGAAKSETMNACLRAITDLAKAEDVDDLLTLSRASRKDLRDAACIALGLIGSPVPSGGPAPGGKVVTNDPPKPPPGPVPVPEWLSRVIARLLEIVEKDETWEVRDSAERALIRIGEPAREATAAKVPALVDAPDRDIALTAIDLAGLFKASEAHRSLLKTAQVDKDPVRRMYAARALGSENPQLAGEELFALIKRDKKGREQTLNAVRALGYVRNDAVFHGLVEMVGSTEWSEPMLREAEKALERLTRRRFGRSPDRWDLWYSKAKDADPFVFHVPHYDRTKQRKDAVGQKKFGLTESTERAVEAGLRWLEDQQHADGAWDGNEKGFNGFKSCEPAYTGLALLAYLGAGYSPVQGKYCETIRRGVEYLAAAQYYDGGFPVAGTGDQTAFFAYVIGMANWAINEAYTISADPLLRAYAQRGVDYMIRTQTPGGGWRYGPRYLESDASCTSWVYMGLKAGLAGGLHVPQKSLDGIDMWFEKAQTDLTGETERPEDMTTDFDREVGVKRSFKAITGYLPITESQKGTYHQDSMTPVGMVCRFFMGWKRSHPFLIGSANYTSDTPPIWMKGPGIGEYYYYWYYGTLAMYQMGGRYWRAWNEKIKTMLPEKQRIEPPTLAGSWDPDTSRGGGGRLFSTPAAILTLETYYRFSPLLEESDEDLARRLREKQAADEAKGDGAKDGGKHDAPAMDGAKDGAKPDAPAMEGGDGSKPEPAPMEEGMGEAPAPSPPAMDGEGMGG